MTLSLCLSNKLLWQQAFLVRLDLRDLGGHRCGLSLSEKTKLAIYFELYQYEPRYMAVRALITNHLASTQGFNLT